MTAYKIWHDTKHFIHKDTTNELNVKWTTDINQALNADNLYKEIAMSSYSKAIKFFYDTLGFNMAARYDKLILC